MRDYAAAADALRHRWDEMSAAGDRTGRLCADAATSEWMHVQRRSRLETELIANPQQPWPALAPPHELRALIGLGWAAQNRLLAGVRNENVAQRIDLLLDAALGDATLIYPELHLHAAAAAVRLHSHEDRIAGVEATIARAMPRFDAADSRRASGLAA